MEMDKDLFIKTINFMKHLNEESEEFNNLLHKIDPEFGGGYIHSDTLNFLTDLLKELVGDTYDQISYFLWELDFGEKYYDGCVVDTVNNTNIPLATAEDLYNLIQSEK